MDRKCGLNSWWRQYGNESPECVSAIRSSCLSPIVLFLICLISFLVVGCGGPPSIRDSTVVAVGFVKTNRICFVYRDLKMKKVESSSYGQGASVVDTGFDGFGQRLATQAGKAFEARKVSVLSAAVLGDRESLPGHFPSVGNVLTPILVVAPVSGTTHANRHSTRTSYTFSAQLLDPQNRRLLWKATIDTSTWAGSDFVMKNVQKTVYDDHYALQLMQAIAEQMGEAGLI